MSICVYGCIYLIFYIILLFICLVFYLSRVTIRASGRARIVARCPRWRCCRQHLGYAALEEFWARAHPRTGILALAGTQVLITVY